MTEARWVFPFEAGIAVAKTVLYQLETAAALHGVQFHCVKGPGWLSAAYTCVVTGQSENVKRYSEAVVVWFRQVRDSR